MDAVDSYESRGYGDYLSEEEKIIQKRKEKRKLRKKKLKRIFKDKRK